MIWIIISTIGEKNKMPSSGLRGGWISKSLRDYNRAASDPLRPDSNQSSSHSSHKRGYSRKSFENDHGNENIKSFDIKVGQKNKLIQMMEILCQDLTHFPLLNKLKYFYSIGYRLGSSRDLGDVIIQKGADFSGQFFVGGSVIYTPEGIFLSGDSPILDCPEFLDNSDKNPIVLTKELSDIYLNNSVKILDYSDLKEDFEIYKGNHCYFEKKYPNKDKGCIEIPFDKFKENDITKILFDKNSEKIGQLLGDYKKSLKANVIKGYIQGYVPVYAEGITLNLHRNLNKQYLCSQLNFSFEKGSINNIEWDEGEKHLYRGDYIRGANSLDGSSKFLWIKDDLKFKDTFFYIIK